MNPRPSQEQHVYLSSHLAALECVLDDRTQTRTPSFHTCRSKPMARRSPMSGFAASSTVGPAARVVRAGSSLAAAPCTASTLCHERQMRAGHDEQAHNIMMERPTCRTSRWHMHTSNERQTGHPSSYQRSFLIRYNPHGCSCQTHWPAISIQ